MQIWLNVTIDIVEGGYVTGKLDIDVEGHLYMCIISSYIRRICPKYQKVNCAGFEWIEKLSEKEMWQVLEAEGCPLAEKWTIKPKTCLGGNQPLENPLGKKLSLGWDKPQVPQVTSECETGREQRHYIQCSLVMTSREMDKLTQDCADLQHVKGSDSKSHWSL